MMMMLFVEWVVIEMDAHVWWRVFVARLLVLICENLMLMLMLMLLLVLLLFRYGEPILRDRS